MLPSLRGKMDFNYGSQLSNFDIFDKNDPALAYLCDEVIRNDDFIKNEVFFNFFKVLISIHCFLTFNSTCFYFQFLDLSTPTFASSDDIINRLFSGLEDEERKEAEEQSMFQFQNVGGDSSSDPSTGVGSPSDFDVFGDYNISNAIPAWSHAPQFSTEVEVKEEHDYASPKYLSSSSSASPGLSTDSGHHTDRYSPPSKICYLKKNTLMQ